jgi:hypothetical protein
MQQSLNLQSKREQERERERERACLEESKKERERETITKTTKHTNGCSSMSKPLIKCRNKITTKIYKWFLCTENTKNETNQLKI